VIFHGNFKGSVEGGNPHFRKYPRFNPHYSLLSVPHCIPEHHVYTIVVHERPYGAGLGNWLNHIIGTTQPT
jgi:hypothetical protein